MVRGILAAVVGYIAMFFVVFVCLTVAYIALGTDKAFEPGTYVPSMIWLVTMLVIGGVAAVMGGLVCGKIGAGKGVKILMGIIVVFSALSISMEMSRGEDDRPTVRDGDVGNTEAMMNARTPMWVNLANPIIGILGVAIGAGLARKKK